MQRTNGGKRALAAVASLALMAFCDRAGDPNPAGQPAAGGDKDKRAAALVAALDADGFTVREGSVELTDIVYAVNSYFMDSGAGANAGQVYKRWVVPALSGQTGTPPFLFRLAPDEAVVYVGKTPPQCDHFSFCPFLWSRSYPDSYLPTGDWLFASAVDPLNNAWIKTEGHGNPSQKNTIIVLTADEGVYERIKQAAGAANFPISMVNPLVLPSNVLKLGTSVHSDSLFVLIRTANIASQAQEQRYLADRQWAKLYRVTPRTAPMLQPYAQPPWRERAWKN
jgi:hypothetical protein